MKTPLQITILSILLFFGWCNAWAFQVAQIPDNKNAVASASAQEHGQDRKEQEVKKDRPEEKKPIRIGFLGITSSGASGLFSVFDSDTLEQGEFRSGPALSRFHRSPGNISVTQFPLNYSVGATNRLEVFLSVNALQTTHIGDSSVLSGSLLETSLRTNRTATSNLLSGTGGQRFYLLPGLPVSGALTGGILPGFPQGTAQAVYDPVLMISKSAYNKAAFNNDLPFLSQGGQSFGGTMIGAKYRFSKVDPTDPKARPFKLLSSFYSTSVLGYVQLPGSYATHLLSASDSTLFRGGSAGTVDFGVFLGFSLYTPFSKKDAQASSNPDSNSPAEFRTTTNTHFNFGLVHNSDPKVGGKTLVDRRNAFVFGFGMDRMVNRFIQGIGDFKVLQYIGGGTPNASDQHPADFTAGIRFYPFGLLKPEVDPEKKRNKFFLSFGLAYRYSFNQASLRDVLGNNHGFVFDITLGLSKNPTRVGTGPGPVLPGCADPSSPALTISPLTANNVTLRRREVLELHATLTNYDLRVKSYKVALPDLAFDSMACNKEGTNGCVRRKDGNAVVYEWTSTNNSKVTLQEDDGKVVVKYPVDLPRRAGYQATLSVAYKNLGEYCPPNTSKINFNVVNSKPQLELTSTPSGLLSATVPQTVSLQTVASDPDGDPVTLTWHPPADIFLGGNEQDRVRSFDSRMLKEGQKYSVAVTASDGQDAEEKSVVIVVNNRPTVKLRALSPTGTQTVEQGQDVKLIAEGEDKDGQQLTYTWDTSSLLENSTAIESGPTNAERLVRTGTLSPGSYRFAVIVSDGIDKSIPAELTLTVSGKVKQPNGKAEEQLRNAAKVLFATNSYRIREKQEQVLLREVNWLHQSATNAVELRLEGNTDPRGKDAYNLRLGCRRANSVKTFLASHGVESQQIKIVVSYGESKSHKERNLWKGDRRVDVLYLNRGSVGDNDNKKAYYCPQ